MVIIIISNNNRILLQLRARQHQLVLATVYYYIKLKYRVAASQIEVIFVPFLSLSSYLYHLLSRLVQYLIMEMPDCYDKNNIDYYIQYYDCCDELLFVYITPSLPPLLCLLLIIITVLYLLLLRTNIIIIFYNLFLFFIMIHFIFLFLFFLVLWRVSDHPTTAS